MATTWNPSDKDANIVLSGGNLVATSSAGSGTVNTAVRATTAISATIKQYFEVTITGTIGQYMSVGVMNATASLVANVGQTNGAAFVKGYSGNSFSNIYRNGGATATNYPNPAAGQTIRVAVDRTANRVWWAVNNNTWSGSAVWMGDTSTNNDPNTGLGGLDITSVTGTIYPAYSSAWTGDVATLNPGPTLTYAVPSGFSAIDAGVAAPAAQAMAMVLA